jgi:hypothetical protein
MRLVRLAVINLSPDPRNKPAAFLIRDDRVDVEITPVTDLPGTRLIAKATTPIDTPGLNDAGFVVIPAEPRQWCEAAIMRAADVLAISTRCARSVVTGTPPLALVPEDAVDLALLAKARAIRADAPHALSTFITAVGLADLGPALHGRWDGAALLAEAYSHTQLSGRYREFVRLFEVAFGRSFMQMDKKLGDSLAPAMGYTAAEVRRWQALRHPFSHADGKKTDELALESDARPVVQRMEQAALDILMNKAEWGQWSSARRNIWRPEAITVDAMGKGVVLQGSAPTLEWLLLDEFGVFPRVVEMQHTKLPDAWWHRFVPEEPTT